MSVEKRLHCKNSTLYTVGRIWGVKVRKKFFTSFLGLAE